MRRSWNRLLMMIAIAAVAAPLVWRLAGIAAVVVERSQSGRWPTYGDAMFRSHAVLQWMMRHQIDIWLWWGPLLFPVFALLWLRSTQIEEESGTGIARRFRIMASAWVGSVTSLLILVWIRPTGVF